MYCLVQIFLKRNSDNYKSLDSYTEPSQFNISAIELVQLVYDTKATPQNKLKYKKYTLTTMLCLVVQSFYQRNNDNYKSLDSYTEPPQFNISSIVLEYHGNDSKK